MSIDDFVAAAQTILKTNGMKTDFVRGHDLAFYRCETLTDRHLELVFRPRKWTISYVFLPTKKNWRPKGCDVAQLEESLRLFCEAVAFEPSTESPDSHLAFR